MKCFHFFPLWDISFWKGRLFLLFEWRSPEGSIIKDEKRANQNTGKHQECPIHTIYTCKSIKIWRVISFSRIRYNLCTYGPYIPNIFNLCIKHTVCFYHLSQVTQWMITFPLTLMNEMTKRTSDMLLNPQFCEITKNIYSHYVACSVTCWTVMFQCCRSTSSTSYESEEEIWWHFMLWVGYVCIQMSHKKLPSIDFFFCKSNSVPHRPGETAMQKKPQPDTGLEFRTFLLWGNSTNHHTTALPHIKICNELFIFPRSIN